MFLLNSYLGLFTATQFLELLFLRTYEVILQSSLTTILSLTLGFSPRLRVFVLGTGHTYLTLETFLESWRQILHYLDRSFRSSSVLHFGYGFAYTPAIHSKTSTSSRWLS